MAVPSGSFVFDLSIVAPVYSTELNIDGTGSNRAVLENTVSYMVAPRGLEL